MNKLKLTMIAMLASSLAGCATIDQLAGGSASPVSKGTVAKGAGIGCAAGGALGAIFAGKDGALRGCAAGGLIGGGFAYKQELARAREAADAARLAGMKATVDVKTETTADGKATEKFQGLVVEYDPASVVKPDEKTKAFFDKLGTILKSSKNELTVRTEGGAGCLAVVGELNGRAALAKHKLDNQCGNVPTHRILVSPLPELK
ncbi:MULTISPECIES: hypothetical protein [unclassified Stenotrophomonas]|uniref:hypothetical protein n=1 Tax=unclassified Stenotrophomonas TaxID=196198 RepID=UPI0021C666BC|nr:MULTISPECIES: hypothetical protein [unclassified Stenotrophomonas]MDY0978614.1 hypothetical protein [Stenotrophomonas sp. CFBP8994]